MHVVSAGLVRGWIVDAMVVNVMYVGAALSCWTTSVDLLAIQFGIVEQARVLFPGEEIGGRTERHDGRMLW